MYVSRLSFILLFLSFNLLAAGMHHKNTILGGRAATMSGAYLAVSDDASGAFYNPAGIAMAPKDSVSGSANAFEYNNATYEEAIGGQDWERKSDNLVPNYFGVLKRFKKSAFSFTYGRTDSFEENQNQRYQNLTQVASPISIYSLVLKTQETTFLVGPTYAYSFSDKFSMGLSLHYYKRVFRRYQNEHIEFSDDSDEISFNHYLEKEKGVRAKLGYLWTPSQKWSWALSLARTQLYTALSETTLSQKSAGSSNGAYYHTANTTIPKLPWEVSLGVANFISPFFLWSLDIDYFIHSDPNKESVVNASLGFEYYTSTQNAIRWGVYTNRSNSKPATSSTTGIEHIDFYGASLGYAMHTKGNIITMGMVGSYGDGDVQVHQGSSTISPLKKYTISAIISSDFAI